MTLQIPKVVPNDWNRLRLIVDKLKHLRLGTNSSPTFVGLTLDDLITDTITIKDSDGNIVVYADVNEIYFTSSVSIPIAAGHGMPWLFWFTYAAP